VQEAEVSENEDVSTDDEDGSDLDQMEESFVSEGCTPLSQNIFHRFLYFKNTFFFTRA
jgi:hypothetical protein